MTHTADDFDGDINAARIHNAIDDYYDSIKDWSPPLYAERDAYDVTNKVWASDTFVVH